MDNLAKPFPEKVTKRELQKMYGIPKKMLRPILNHYIDTLGKNKRCRIIPSEIVIMIIRDLGTPGYYILPDSIKEKLSRI
jgi:hypothetical protein